MPAETAPHAATWMAWPSSGYTLGETAAEADAARAAWTSVAHAVAEFEPVKMVVDPAALEVARKWLSGDIELLCCPLDDAWMRDMGPSFVIDQATGTLGAVDWVFNGWGQQSWASWEKDAKVARQVAEWAGATIVSSPMVNEGGAIHVDGAGLVMVTETVQRGAGRNPDWTRQQVEAELSRTIGASTVVWFERGLSRDYDEFGTRGHVDLLATAADSSAVLLHDQRNSSHPDYTVSAELRARLTADLPDWEILSLPAPQTLRDEHGPVDYSYVNHLVCNGGVIACSFGDPHDDAAAGILADAYPGRTVVSVDARELFARGGGIHCITQQQPA
ncbi:agmatine deiminase family protein [Nakamurella antarctica]|uniref:Agmatine deiminase family protein n=1 Tax=Nakamurella antarctica TaxID=1902245 RepID=A0A3G8ZS06_9ACTN|nr:agmatine deiminase family protein [Nakamurella antarctica]